MFTHQLSPTWREIVKVSTFDKVIHVSCCYKVANSMTIRFWLDRWFNYFLLRMLFPHLFRLFSHQNATIQEVDNYDTILITLVWNRPLRDREC